MMKNNILTYKVALVTGASSGIGAEIAKELCLRNIKVYAVARSKVNLSKVENSLPKKYKSNFILVNKDLTRENNIAQIVKLIKKNNDTVDLLINNAGVGFNKPFEQQSDKEAQTTIATNLMGPILLTKLILSVKKKSSPLHIVFTTSLAGKVGFGGLSVYSASKFALEGLAESLRLEYQDSDVSITVLRPGITDTGFFKKAGMLEFRNSVKNERSFYTPDIVANVLIKKISNHNKPNSIIVGNDKYFLALLPFIPFKLRFKVLDIINKL